MQRTHAEVCVWFKHDIAHYFHDVRGFLKLFAK